MNAGCKNQAHLAHSGILIEPLVITERDSK